MSNHSSHAHSAPVRDWNAPRQLVSDTIRKLNDDGFITGEIWSADYSVNRYGQLEVDILVTSRSTALWTRSSPWLIEADMIESEFADHLRIVIAATRGAHVAEAQARKF